MRRQKETRVHYAAGLGLALALALALPACAHQQPSPPPPAAASTTEGIPLNSNQTAAQTRPTEPWREGQYTRPELGPDMTAAGSGVATHRGTSQGSAQAGGAAAAPVAPQPLSAQPTAPK